MGYWETGEVLKVDRSCSGLVWLAAGVAEGRVLGPCRDGAGKWHWCPAAKGVQGKCWVSAHLCGKKREVLVQRSRICSKNTVVKGYNVYWVWTGCCWSSMARRDGEGRKPLGR